MAPWGVRCGGNWLTVKSLAETLLPASITVMGVKTSTKAASMTTCSVALALIKRDQPTSAHQPTAAAHSAGPASLRRRSTADAAGQRTVTGGEGVVDWQPDGCLRGGCEGLLGEGQGTGVWFNVGEHGEDEDGFGHTFQHLI